MVVVYFSFVLVLLLSLLQQLFVECQYCLPINFLGVTKELLDSVLGSGGGEREEVLQSSHPCYHLRFN